MATTGPLLVIALGGNALLRRGEPMDAGTQMANVRRAGGWIAALAHRYRLVVAHGNGPQVGLLALQNDACARVPPYPLDVLGAETEGMIGYMLELGIGNELPAPRAVATLLTRVVVDRDDPAFRAPTKPIGPVYDEPGMRELAGRQAWRFAPDGGGFRRVVASPLPRHIVGVGAVRALLDQGSVVICAGGGGIPVVATADGRQEGVEAVIDKDRVAALLARQLDADALIIATDVDGVFLDWGLPTQRLVRQASPQALRTMGFAPGSMGPKVEAACDFAQATGRRAAIGALDRLGELAAGTVGTQIAGGHRGIQAH